MKNGVEFDRQSLKTHLGEDNLKRLINFSLRYIADLDIPIKRYLFSISYFKSFFLGELSLNLEME